MQCRTGPIPELFRNARMTHNSQYFESASGKTRCLAVTIVGDPMEFSFAIELGGLKGSSKDFQPELSQYFPSKVQDRTQGRRPSNWW